MNCIMKTNKIILILSAVATLFASSCQKEVLTQNPYTRNTGEEYLNVSTDLLEFQGRGGSMTFIVSNSYDARIAAPEWVTLTSLEVPGDGREFTLTATVPANSGEGASDRSGDITITTVTLTRTIHVTQPYYQRPDCPLVISSKEDFLSFIEVCAPFYEVGETVEMTSDIDLKDVTLSNNAETFKGVLNGNGYKITNWNATSPLFEKNEGVINNLRIDSSCTLTVAASDVDFMTAPFVGKNYGTISKCTNEASIILSDNYVVKTYIGGLAGYNYAGAKIDGCVNKGEIKFAPQSASSNAYIGGMSGYNYGSVVNCETYGPLYCNPSSFKAVYFMGGIVARHETGDLTGNIVHKEAKVYTNNQSGSGKSYIGGLVGYVEGAPKTSNNQVYCDVEVNLKVEAYIGALQGWQAKVDDASKPSATIFEGSIVNSNITAYTKGMGANGNNPCNSAGFVTGRFSGQSGKATTLHYGTSDNPIKVSGSITCLQTGTKKVASAKDYLALLDGDGSKTSVNIGAIPETDYSTIQYEVRGDGQTGDPEDMIIKTDAVKLTVASEGGEAKFNARGNYTMTLKPEVDWLSVDCETVAGDGEYHEITVTALANDHTYTRTGTIAITMPMGSTEIVTVTQGGNTTLPESLEVDRGAIEGDPAGTEKASFKVCANYDATVTPGADWISVDPTTVTGDEQIHTVTVTFEKNQSGAARTSTITIEMPRGKSHIITVSQEKFVYIPKAEINNAADFLDFMAFGSDAELYPASFEVKLTADIDLKGKTVGTISTFNGNFNGQGHCLKNIKSDVPVFGINKGEIKNLILDSSCSFTLDPAKAPTSGSAIWTGALCGNSDPGTISGCTNKAAVTMTAVPTMQTFIGGIAGRSAASVTISDCTNEGAVTIKPSAAIAGVELRIAGVVAGSNGSLVNCVNNAPVEFSPADLSGKGFYLGGVAAYLTAQPMTGCTNTAKGTVTFNPAAYSGSTQSYIGGLLGYVDKKTTVSGCKAFGNVKVTADHETLATGGFIGWIKAGAAGFILGDGCAVNCNVTAVTPASGVTASTNPLKSAGLVVGRVTVKSGADNVTCQIATAESPLKVAGSLTVNGGATVTATAENYTNFLFGNSMSSNFFNPGSYKMDAANCVFEAVTQ